MESIFGTDGIRGVANRYPITPELALNVGRAVAAVLKTNNRARIFIGKDGRLSGDMLEAALAAGICSAGADVYLAGIIPTPAIAYLATINSADAGIMVSASHNPFEDNGIKIFNSLGYKLEAAEEERIENLALNPGQGLVPAPPEKLGGINHMLDAWDRYIEFLKRSLGKINNLNGLRIVLDCSNGATSMIAPRLFSELGASVTAIANRPDGLNINENCGSQHIETLQEKVREKGADIGLAFDGDGDRLIAVDENGEPVTGDHVLAICANHMKQAGMLKNNLVVSTVMSNLGLINALKKMDISHIATDVGDRYVLEEMRKNRAVMGGEDSGHMIFLDHHTSGDGIMTALRLIEAMQLADEPLSSLRRIMTVYPQVLKNVRVRTKTDIYKFPEIAQTIERVEKHLGEQGRVLVRYSGTQPLCRIMVEGPCPRRRHPSRQACQLCPGLL
ncbi:MAG: phosphoglucosamine mutase, partial [Desulfobacteraceae bacterium]|nr:phosphoglucosamine mutase [Desulfobacteraceae bacterium]